MLAGIKEEVEKKESLAAKPRGLPRPQRAMTSAGTLAAAAGGAGEGLQRHQRAQEEQDTVARRTSSTSNNNRQPRTSKI